MQLHWQLVSATDFTKLLTQICGQAPLFSRGSEQDPPLVINIVMGRTPLVLAATALPPPSLQRCGEPQGLFHPFWVPLSHPSSHSPTVSITNA